MEGKITKPGIFQKNLLDKQKVVKTIREGRETCKKVEGLIKTATEASKIATTRVTRMRIIPYWWNEEIT